LILLSRHRQTLPKYAIFLSTENTYIRMYNQRTSSLDEDHRRTANWPPQLRQPARPRTF